MDYQITNTNIYSNHGGHSIVTVVSDDEHIATHEMQLDAMAHSGEYFSTIAASLEQMLERMEKKDSRIQNLINDFLYLQDRYELIAKN